MSDVKHNLRKLAFPQCAREALTVIEQLTLTHSAGRAVTSKSMDLASEIMSEFLFFESGASDSRFSSNDRSKMNRDKKLTHIQELQLLEVLLYYFAYPRPGTNDTGKNSTGLNNNAARNTVFMNLFPDTHKERSRLLVKLVSISIPTMSKPVLSAAGIWMQQLGCTSSYSLEMAKGIVDDYFILVPEAVERLQELPQLAPQFTANFLTAVAELYSGKEGQDNLPSDTLLEVVTNWVSKSTSLCTAALSCPEPALPQGGIPMPPITPFAGLFRWCVLAPLIKSNPSKLYSQLHLALLESLLDSNAPKENVVSAQHLASIVEPVLTLSEGKSTDAVDLALDRLGQAVQVVMESNSAYGKKQELFKELDKLPHNRLLTLVKAKHRTL